MVRPAGAGAGQRRLVARLLVERIDVGDRADGLERLEVLVDGGSLRWTARCSCSALGCSREEARASKIASRWVVTDRPRARQ